MPGPFRAVPQQGPAGTLRLERPEPRLLHLAIARRLDHFALGRIGGRMLDSRALGRGTARDAADAAGQPPAR